jgi:hypothetical protein
MAIVKASVYTTSALTTAAQRLAPALNKGAGSGMAATEQSALNITQKGLSTVQNHVASFGEDAANKVMLNNLGNALNNGQNLAGANLNFYTHELTEASLMAKGVCYPMSHGISLITQGVSEFSLYTPAAIQAADHAAGGVPTWSLGYYMYWGMMK